MKKTIILIYAVVLVMCTSWAFSRAHARCDKLAGEWTFWGGCHIPKDGGWVRP